MAKAIVDPAELRKFARDLARFTQELQSMTASMNSKMNQLEQSWRDQEQKKFAEEFRQTTRALGRFGEASQQHVQFLVKKATQIEDYLNQ